MNNSKSKRCIFEIIADKIYFAICHLKESYATVTVWFSIISFPYICPYNTCPVSLYNYVMDGEFQLGKSAKQGFYKGNYFFPTFDSAWPGEIKDRVFHKSYLKFRIVPVIQRAHKCLSKMSIRNCFFQVSSINGERYK